MPSLDELREEYNNVIEIQGGTLGPDGEVTPGRWQRFWQAVRDRLPGSRHHHAPTKPKHDGEPVVFYHPSETRMGVEEQIRAACSNPDSLDAFWKEMQATGEWFVTLHYTHGSTTGIVDIYPFGVPSAKMRATHTELKIHERNDAGRVFFKHDNNVYIYGGIGDKNAVIYAENVDITVMLAAEDQMLDADTGPGQVGGFPAPANTDYKINFSLQALKGSITIPYVPPYAMLTATALKVTAQAVADTALLYCSNMPQRDKDAMRMDPESASFRNVVARYTPTTSGHSEGLLERTGEVESNAAQLRGHNGR